MNLERAKSRRLEAIHNRRGDRVLVKPSAHADHVKLPDDGTVADFLINALAHGCTTDDVEAATGWSKSTVMVNLYKVAKKSGVGIRRSAETMYLMLPPGTPKAYPKAKVVASGSTVRSMAEEVVIVEHRP